MRKATFKQTFWIESPRDLLDKLKYEHDRLDAGGLNIPYEVPYIVLNGALTAWHMSDWLFQATRGESRDRLRARVGAELTPRVIQGWASDRCEEVRICGHIATAGKHFEVFPHIADPELETEIEVINMHRLGGGVDMYIGVFIHCRGRTYAPHDLLGRSHLFWMSVLDDIEGVDASARS
jgi:hypothetical protein